jgi:endonuclease G, mitochondrial
MRSSWRLIIWLVFLTLSVPATSQDFGECQPMIEVTGAPEYLGDDPPQHQVLCRLGYLLSNNLDTKVPDWVLEDLTSDRLEGDATRRNNFAADPELPPGKRAELSDYAGRPFDRGHLAPADDMQWDQVPMDESFLLSNMAPQRVPFNRGIWARLEGTVRKWAKRTGRVIVISGPIYSENDLTIGASEVTVPLAFYKIVYDPDLRRAIAFRIPNQRQTGHRAPEFIVKIRDLEDETGLDFLTGLSDREQDRIETQVSAMWRQ